MCLQFQKQGESIAAGDFSQREGSTHINLIEQLKELSLGNGEAAGNGVAHAEAYGNGLAEDEAVEEREADAAPGHAHHDFAGALTSDESSLLGFRTLALRYRAEASAACIQPAPLVCITVLNAV